MLYTILFTFWHLLYFWLWITCIQLFCYRINRVEMDRSVFSVERMIRLRSGHFNDRTFCLYFQVFYVWCADILVGFMQVLNYLLYIWIYVVNLPQSKAHLIRNCMLPNFRPQICHMYVIAVFTKVISVYIYFPGENGEIL